MESKLQLDGALFSPDSTVSDLVDNLSAAFICFVQFSAWSTARLSRSFFFSSSISAVAPGERHARAPEGQAFCTVRSNVAFLGADARKLSSERVAIVWEHGAAVDQIRSL